MKPHSIAKNVGNPHVYVNKSDVKMKAEMHKKLVWDLIKRHIEVSEKE